MRNICIGDVHGCYDELQGLIEQLEPKGNDTLYFVGDMINKGPQSYEVLEYMYRLGSRCKGILGNHETKFLQHYESILENPRAGIFHELAQKLETSPYILEYLRSLPQYREEENFTVVHAGMFPGIPLGFQEESLGSIGKILKTNWYEEYDGEKPLIYGHWSELGLKVRDKTIGIDTACVEGGSLTAFIVETREIVQEVCYKKGGYF